MAAPRKYPDELRERAVRMAVDLRRDPATRKGALARVGEQLGINTDTLRNWVKPALVDDGERPGLTSSDRARLVELDRTGPVTAETARRILDYAGGTLVMPMTVLVEQYWREISVGLTSYGVPVRHFVLHADEATLRARIAGRAFVEEAARAQSV